MLKNTGFSPSARAIVVAAGLAVVIVATRAVGSFLGAVFMALILVICLIPLVNWLRRKGLPNWLALLITLVVFVTIIVALVVFLTTAFSQLAEALPTYVDSSETRTAELQAQLVRLGIDASDTLALLDLEYPARFIELITSFLASLIGTLALVFVMLMIFVFMFLETSGFSVRLRKGLAPDNPLLARFREFSKDVKEYWWITSAIAFVIAVLDAIFLLILGVDFALLWGAVAFLLSYIPSLGFWLALIPPFLLAWAQFGFGTAMIVFIGYVLINGSIQNFVQPKVMGGGVNLSPLVVTISVVVWTWALGPIGAILAIPATMLVKKLFLERYEETRWLAIAIGEGRGRQDVANDDSGPGTGT